ncbi:MAG: Ig-like domain-containing protein [Spirochaetes bacterium]|nr:Ig-like domain-containing protein [Spirochaetota bacterium]
MKKIFAAAVFIIFLSSCGGGTIGDAQNFEPNEPPSIVEVSALSVDGSPTDALKAGMKFTITVKARDPENKKLKFQFNSDYGYFGNPTETADSCTIPFVTGSFVRPGLPVTIDVSVIDHKDASAVTNYEIGKGRRGPTVTVKYIGSAYIQKEKNTQISFKADCEGIYQLYCDNSVDESSAGLRPALAYFLYRKDSLGNFKEITVDVAGPASSTDAKVRLTTAELQNKVWVVFSDGINDPFAALAPITVDNTPPTLSIDTGGSMGVGLRAPLRLVFNEDIMPSSVSDNSVEVEDGGSFFFASDASGKCSVEGSVVTFVPDSLEYYSTYKVSAKSGIKDLAGNEYAGTTSGTFTTVEKGTTPNPVFSKATDIYDDAQTVGISVSDPDTKIFFTTAIGSADAVIPTSKSDEYTGTAINAAVNTDIKAVAVARGYKQSSVASVKIKIRTPTPKVKVEGNKYPGIDNLYYSDITLTPVVNGLPSGESANCYYYQTINADDNGSVNDPDVNADLFTTLTLLISQVTIVCRKSIINGQII